MLHMASVRIPNDIMQEIRKAALDKFLVADPAPSNTPNITSLVLDAIHESPSYKAIREFVANPEVKKFEGKSCSASSYMGALFQTYTVESIEIRGIKDTKGVEKPFTTKLPAPATMLVGERWSTQMAIHIDLLKPEHRDAIKQEVEASMLDQADWEKRRAAFVKSTDEIFSACRTTGQLLAAWPQAEAFMPQRLVVKMNTKTTNTIDEEAKAKREAFDPTNLNPTLLIAGMLGDDKGTS